MKKTMIVLGVIMTVSMLLIANALRELSEGNTLSENQIKAIKTADAVDFQSLEILKSWVSPTGDAHFPDFTANAGYGVKLVYRKIFTAEDEVSSLVIPVPAGGRHLKLIANVRVKENVGVTLLSIQFNGDTGQNYWDNYIANHENSAVAAGADIGSNPYLYAGYAVGSGGTTGQYGFVVVDIFGHNNPSSFTSAISVGAGVDTGSLRRTAIQGGSWESLDIVTQITFLTAGGSTMEAGSTISLYVYE